MKESKSSPLSQITKVIYSSEIGDILENTIKQKMPSFEDCVRLLESDDIYFMGFVAGQLTRQRFGNKVSFVNNIILNYTNVCITDCKFCAFYRTPGDDESYTLTLEDINTRVKTALDVFKIKQVLFQGGHNPELGVEYFEDAFRLIRKNFPVVGVHGLSPSEIDMIAHVERSSTLEILSRLKEAGLQSIPGAGAEILVDKVKNVISPKKITSDQWLKIMEESHSLGIPSSATMMYGHVESNQDITDHFFKILNLQKKTGGFMAFIPWSFEPNNTEMQQEKDVIFGAGGIQLLKMISISRIILDSYIPHLQSSWLTNGIGMAQLAIQHGADDFGGTLIGEEVVSCTGARSTELTDKKIIDSIHQIGMEAIERDNFYNPLRTI